MLDRWCGVRWRRLWDWRVELVVERRWLVEAAVEAKVEVEVVRLGEKRSKVARLPGGWCIVGLWMDDGQLLLVVVLEVNGSARWG